MKQAEMTIPHLFRCPITLDLFKDPVTLCTGQTYDRSSIEKWLAAGNLTCPVTMQKLQDLSMVPNHTLRHLIHRWLQKGLEFHSDNYFVTIDSLATLKQDLESLDSTMEKKIQTLEIIKAVSQESASASYCLLQLGLLPLLLELIFGKADPRPSQERVEFAERAISCVLALLSFSDLESLNLLKEGSKLETFRVIFEHGSSKIKCDLCQVIEAISASLETRELCLKLAENHQLLKQLVLLVHRADQASSEAGIKAITALCSVESARENLIQEGVVNGLLTYISVAEGQERNLAPKALATIELLLGLESGKEAVINDPNGVNTLVKMVFRVSSQVHEGSESAIRSLTIICSDSLQAREEAICGSILTQLLLLLQSQCSGRTKSKARTLLKLLRSKWDEEPKHF